MLYRLLADTVLVVHFAFVVFAVGGGLLVAWRRWVARLHVPAAAWAALIMFGGWICPLTPLENHLRRAAGQAGYEGGFLEHYVVSVLYPSGLTREIQVVLGVVVIAVNVAAYAWALRRARREALAGA